MTALDQFGVSRVGLPVEQLILRNILSARYYKHDFPFVLAAAPRRNEDC
jgi:hypothetical protein